MKKLLSLLFLCAMILNTGCEKRLFKTIVTYNFNETYTLTVDGRRDVPPTTITRADLLDGLNIPDDAQITKVTIENVSAKVSENVEQSQAYFVNLEGFYVKPDGKKKLFPQFPIPIASATFTRINNTIAEDIQGLANQLSAILLDENNTQSASVELTVFTSSPLAIDLHFQLGISVHYEVCREVAIIFGGGGEKCE
ncbi:MAG: hypothetical protein DWQ05_07005 [Calditrichaeota bacterium]|nr:MAG: hypothetical protein DWQ05_07005 [Calditrichota bacterium]